MRSAAAVHDLEVVVERHAVGSLCVHGVGQCPLLVLIEGLLAVAPAGDDARPRHDRRVEPARGIRGQGTPLVVGQVELGIHDVCRAEVVDQPVLHPGRHVQAQVRALVDGGEHVRAQEQPLALPPALARGIEHRADAGDQLGHHVPAVASGSRREVAMVAVADLDAVHVEGVHQARDRAQHEGAHLLVAEVERGGLRIQHPGRSLLKLQVRIVHDEAGAGAHALGGGHGAVVVVHAESGAEPDAASAALVQQDAKRLPAVVYQRQEPPVLRSGVVVEALGAPVGGPALGICLLNEQVDPGRGDVVDPVAQRRLGDGIRQIPAGDAGWIADVDGGHIAAHRRTLAVRRQS